MRKPAIQSATVQAMSHAGGTTHPGRRDPAPSFGEQAVAGGTRPTLYVCTTCQRAGDTPSAEGTPRAGQLLFEATGAAARTLGADAPAIVPVVCFANCERGCSAAIAQPGKWAYMVGHLGPEHAGDLITYAAAYANSETGAVLRSGRPESLRHAIVGRFPLHLAIPQPPLKDAAE
jgi:predicted metal-binding protein